MSSSDEDTELDDAAQVTNAPAYDTKHLDVLKYRLNEIDTTLTIHQSSTSHSTSSSVWLSAQVLIAYLLQSRLPSRTPRPRCIELGSGTGLLSLALACSGRYEKVTATDTRSVVDSQLGENVQLNSPLYKDKTAMEVRVLDWTRDDDLRQLESDMETAPPTLIIATDTIYSPRLIVPFWKTFKWLLVRGGGEGLLALERRDPTWIDEALRIGREECDLTLGRVEHERIAEAVRKSLKWHNEEVWEGVEVYSVTCGIKD